MPAPVRIIRGDPMATRWWTLTIEGHGLSSLEGRLVSARIGTPDRPPERLGYGQVRVENGAFRIIFPDGLELSLYKRKLVFVDVNADGLCSEGDLVYSDYRAAEADTILTLHGSAPPATPDLELRPTADLATNCVLLNQPWPTD